MVKALPLKCVPPNKLSQSSGAVYQKLDWYQKDAVNFALLKATVAILFDQGTGKTWIAGGLIEKLLAFYENEFSGVLVVPLANKETTWIAFLRKHLPSVSLFEDWKSYRTHTGPKLFLIHWEELNRYAKLIRKYRHCVVIADEAQRAKNRNSRQSRRLGFLNKCSPYRAILTGTPMDEQPTDMWAQFRFLRVEVFGDKWPDFADEYLEPLLDDEEALKDIRKGSFRYKRMIQLIRIKNGKRKFDQSKLPQFLEQVQPWCMRVDQSVLKLDPLIFHKVGVRLRGAQRRLYETMEHDMVVQVDGRTVTAAMTVTKREKMRQICGGYLIDEEGDTVEVGRAKIRRLHHIIRTLLAGDRINPIVVFCRYTAEVDAIVRELEATTTLTVRKLSGKVKRKDRPQVQRDFQAGRVDVLVAQIKTGGVGIDLFRSCIGIMFSPVYSSIDFDQAIKRLRRRGQKRQVHIFLLYAIDTIDEDAFIALAKKRNVVEFVMNRLKQRREQWLTRHTASVISPRRLAYRKQPPARTFGTAASKRKALPTSGRARQRSTLT